MCVSCASGTAGVGGACAPCSAGTQPSYNHTECEQCAEDSAGSDGVCSRCDAGTQPNPSRSACEPCPRGSAGTVGVCELCEPGKEQNPTKTQCIACEPGKAGSLGTDGIFECIFCGGLQVPNAERTEVRPALLAPPFWSLFFAFFRKLTKLSRTLAVLAKMYILALAA